MADSASTPAPAAEVSATRKHLESLRGDDLMAWRVADLPGRRSADERNFPADFPLGWWAVCYSDELAAGQVKAVRYFSRDLAVWRGEDGVARVIDAYCAHYGANMAVGGIVRGNYLECPFHAWRWDGDGSCKEVPYAKVIPPQARRKDCVPHWPTVEANGFVMVWYHPERVEPLWQPVVFNEVGSQDWTAFRKFEWKIYSAPQLASDNAVDISHFKYVHGAPTVPEYDFVFEGITRSVNAYLKLNTPRGAVNGQISSVTHGPGQGWVKFSGLSDTLLITGTAPVERDITHIRFAFTQPKAEVAGPTAGLAKALIRDICSQLDQDKVILDRITQMNHPLVCDGDGPFGRNWTFYNQFYVGESGPKSTAG
jgi:3-ketosteroid 9alpha-monooxygenase subunit A